MFQEELEGNIKNVQLLKGIKTIELYNNSKTGRLDFVFLVKCETELTVEKLFNAQQKQKQYLFVFLPFLTPFFLYIRQKHI